MMAMLKLHHSKTLKDLGWRLLLQIHDEVIMEGTPSLAHCIEGYIKGCIKGCIKGFYSLIFFFMR